MAQSIRETAQLQAYDTRAAAAAAVGHLAIWTSNTTAQIGHQTNADPIGAAQSQTQSPSRSLRPC